MKKATGAQSAKQYAPGQQIKKSAKPAKAATPAQKKKK